MLPDGHGVPLHQAGPMRQVSESRKKLDGAYRRLRDGFLYVNRICEYCGEQAATEVHHKRGRVGADYLDVDHWAALCHRCHVWVTEHPAEAIEQGISERRIGAA